VRSALIQGFFALVLVTAPLGAQRVIRVVSHGEPVASAEVSVWSETTRLARVRTDGGGLARLPLTSFTTSSTVLVRRLGFALARQVMGSADTVVVELSAVSTALPVLAVTSRTLSCPNRPDPSADSLWTSSAAGYAQGASSLFLRWIGGQLEETVPADQRGYGDGEPVKVMGGGGTNPAGASILMRAPPPYALYERHISIVGEYWRWRYAPLHDVAGEHFLSPAFRERHTFQILGRAGDATVVGFCPTRGGEVDVRGELLIGDDHRLHGARWFVQVPHDDEDAGGEATFVATQFEGQSFVVAVRGSTWRRAGRNLYNQDRFERSSWWLSRSSSASAPP
jgi:hypothetical protein